MRKRAGMAFQQPNPFLKFIFEKVDFEPRLLGMHKRTTLSEIVERSLRKAALWDEVKDVRRKP